MALIYGNAANGGTSASSPFTLAAQNVGAPTNDYLVAYAVWDYAGGITVTSLAYAGVGMTGASSTFTDPSSYFRTRRFRLVSPNIASGSNSFLLTLSGSTNCAILWLAFSGVNLSNPPAYWHDSAGTTIHPSDTVTSAVGQMIDECIVYAPTTFTSWDNGQTQRGAEQAVGNFMARVATKAGADGSNVLGSTIGEAVNWIAYSQSSNPATGGFLRYHHLG